MKNIRSSLVFIALVVASVVLARNPRVVKNPDYAFSHLKFCVEEIALSDTATRVKTFIVNQRGYWVKADSGNIFLAGKVSGSLYPLKRVEGLEFGKETWIGDSGYVSATFVFPPLLEADTVASFVEAQGSWFVSDLNLGEPKLPIRTHISGTVQGYNDIPLMAMTAFGDDPRVNNTILMPVRDGRFEYDLYASDTLAWEIFPLQDYFLKGTWTWGMVFSDGVPVEVAVSEDAEKSVEVRSGGILSARYAAYSESLEKEFGTGNVEQTEQNIEKFRARRLERVRNDSSLIGLLEIYGAMKFAADDLDDYIKIYSEKYSNLLPNHPYSIALREFIGAGAAMPGYKVPDFSAPDLEGNMRTLSELIKGRVALVDLWASWCYPCRTKSMSMIPVYERWKDRGFSVVGVAREMGDTKAMQEAIAHDGYPWLCLVELDDRAGIWQRYRAGNSGGKTVLVGADGIVVAIDPTAEEVEAYLTTHCQ